MKISYEAGSANNLHGHIRTVHPSVQLEEERHTSEPAANESASLSTATVAAASLSTASSSTPPPQPARPPTQSSMTQFVHKSTTPVRQNTFDEELAKMVACEFQLCSIVDDREKLSSCSRSNVCYSKQENSVPPNDPKSL